MLIFLIGFMGCGKSYTARRLSQALDMPYVDMDHAIEDAEGMTVAEIFERHGEPWFRAREREWLEKLDPEAGLIVSTGGGAPCEPGNMDLMNKLGVTVFLDTGKDAIVARLLRSAGRRPLLAGMDENDLGFFYDSKMEERRPFYERAAFHFRHQDIDVLVRLLRNLLP